MGECGAVEATYDVKQANALLAAVGDSEF